MNPRANRRRGAKWETDLLKWLREQGWEVERLRLAGKDDEGDLAVVEGGIVTLVEAKNVTSDQLSGLVQEAIVEADNYARARNLDRAQVIPVVVKKRRNRPIGQALVVTTLEEWFR